MKDYPNPDVEFDKGLYLDQLKGRLRSTMALRGMTHVGPLASAAGLNESGVRDILRGRSKNPGVITIDRIAATLDIAPAALTPGNGAVWELVEICLRLAVLVEWPETRVEGPGGDEYDAEMAVLKARALAVLPRFGVDPDEGGADG